jgi:hypothetical protein
MVSSARWQIALAAVVVAACACTSARLSGAAGHGRRTVRSFEAGKSLPANNWMLVAPGGGDSEVTSPRTLDVMSGATSSVRQVPALPGGGSTSYPWASSGGYVAAITGIAEPATHHRRTEGEAYAFQPGGAYVPLGRAINVYAASQPGRFWLRGARFGQVRRPDAKPRHCTMTEVSATGRRLAGPLPAACDRWMIAAAPGGFLFVPTNTPSAVTFSTAQTWSSGSIGFQVQPEDSVQLWSPRRGNVIRSYRIDSGWILGASTKYLVWQRQDRVKGQLELGLAEVTDLRSGATRAVTLPIAPGEHVWRLPVLAPQGQYLAWMEVTTPVLARFRSDLSLSPGGPGVPAFPAPGRVEVLDLVTDRLVLNRAVTVASSGSFAWSPDDRYLFVAARTTSIEVVPTWSATASIRWLRTGAADHIPDTQQFVVTARIPVR